MERRDGVRTDGHGAATGGGDHVRAARLLAEPADLVADAAGEPTRPPGERSGAIDLNLSPSDGGDHRTVATDGARAHIRVPVVSLDELAAQRRTPIHFVKMDIQGAEGVALRGAREVLARPELRGLVLEFWPGALREAGEDPEAVLATIRPAGLRCVNHPDLDADPRTYLAGVGADASRDLLFLRPS